MIPADEWIDAQVVWVVTLRWAGHVWYFADRRVELLDAGGQPVALRTCERPLDIDESLGRLSQQQRGARAALRVVLPVDPVAYRRDGYRLDGADAEVAYVTARQGVAVQTYQRREVVVVGRLREPQYGDPDLPVGTVTASVEATNTADRGTLIGDRILSPFRFSDQADRVRAQHGKGMPHVFGNPGTASRPGSPGYPVDGTGTSTRLLVAGHSVTAQPVVITDPAGATTTKTVAIGVDLQGDVYSYVDLVTADGLDLFAEEFWISWTGNSATLPKVGRPGGVDRVGDLLLWALSLSTLPIDFASWYAIVPSLAGLRVDGYVNEAISPWEYVSRVFGEILPIAITGGEGGLRPVLLTAPALDAAPEVVASRRFTQVGPWTIQGRPGDVANVITVSYARDAADNKATAREVVGTYSDGDTSTARYSRQLYGTSPREVEAAWTDDATTAALVAQSVLDRDALLGESATYNADLGYGWIRVGDWLRLTDRRLGVEGLLVQVIRRRYLGAAWSFELLRVEAPQRDAGRVG